MTVHHEYDSARHQRARSFTHWTHWECATCDLEIHAEIDKALARHRAEEAVPTFAEILAILNGLGVEVSVTAHRTVVEL